MQMSDLKQTEWPPAKLYAFGPKWRRLQPVGFGSAWVRGPNDQHRQAEVCATRNFRCNKAEQSSPYGFWRLQYFSCPMRVSYRASEKCDRLKSVLLMPCRSPRDLPR